MQILISGFGCVCSLGDNAQEITKNLFEQNIEPSYPIGRLDSSYAPQYPVFSVSQNVLSQKKNDESFSYLFLRKSLNEALEQAELNAKDLQTVRVGACIGTSVDASFNCFDFYKSWRKGENKDLKPLDRTLAYSISEQALKDLGLKGISQTIVTACASGTDAIGIGAQWIENDICDIVFAGGADELNLIPFVGFIKLMIASKEPCKPFDKNRNGINLGEGAGIVILESEKFAKKRKAKQAGIVLGYGSACDGYHATSPHPDGRGLRKAAASLGDISRLSFINAHATASIDNDTVEAKVFDDLFPNIPISATKSLTGHALGAAGAIEACLTLISLNNGIMPKTKNFKTKDERINMMPTIENIKFDGSKAAISTSLSFGGCNSVLMLGGASCHSTIF
ncbi:MAG: beta-ketoacyl-[acyl-carrier-protein] synthase family protein [Elusimicrobiota bacterium]|jgi:3-oxoacyl-[acyl-carrier-protein] synthase-1/3-oxoacyl-[acyl-carrier-protein] synthase II|nr:beta-ketoacyl-[acyl-carrier-protein] synthase family protein [Elusimicrobiota bacterium]